MKNLMDKLNELFSAKRTGNYENVETTKARSPYQRDYDRIIFSSAFRRLQNKTQVFPLPGSVFVHNRLTHSLEVSSVGRSLGSLVGKFVFENYSDNLDEPSKKFYRNHLKNVIAAACLCHDIGNPAFGHSGEDAIVSFFEQNKDQLQSSFSEKEYSDFLNFEGNANSIRILAGNQKGKLKGGLGLTYTTLASIAKYPCESTLKDEEKIQRKKFGFLQSEKDTFLQISHDTGMIKDESLDGISFFRHPFVWLVEAADDICYNIIDLEDAQRLRIISPSECEDLLGELISCLGREDIKKLSSTLKHLSDRNERISYLRAKAINSLILVAFDKYCENFERIINGNQDTPLFDLIEGECGAVNDIVKFSIKEIYNHRSVIEIENAGYNVIGELLSHFVFPILKDKSSRRKSDDKALKLIPSQFIYGNETPYFKVLSVIDYLSGMTDSYATDLYKKIKGIDIGMKL